jgi:hypothetical protein
MKIITDTQSRNIAYSRKCFAKPGEPQDKAVKRLMQSINRRRSADPHAKGDFPVFYPGRTTTRSYVLAFLGETGAKHIDVEALGDRLAPYCEGPEVIVEEGTDG